MKANAELRARHLATWQQAQALHDGMNDPLSERYCKQLQDRGCGEGFSRQERSESDVREDVAAGRLVRVLGDWTPPLTRLCMYYPGRKNPSAAFRAFVDVAREITASSSG